LRRYRILNEIKAVEKASENNKHVSSRDMIPHTNPSPYPSSDPVENTKVRRQRREATGTKSPMTLQHIVNMLIHVPFRFKLERILEFIWIQMNIPRIRGENSPLLKLILLKLKVLGEPMWEARLRQIRAPPQTLLNCRLNEWQTGHIVVGGKAFGVGTAYRVKLGAHGGYPRRVGRRRRNEEVVLIPGGVGASFHDRPRYKLLLVFVLLVRSVS
jgi:hypothetical protein